MIVHNGRRDDFAWPRAAGFKGQRIVIGCHLHNHHNSTSTFLGVIFRISSEFPKSSKHIPVVSQTKPGISHEVHTIPLILNHIYRIFRDFPSSPRDFHPKKNPYWIFQWPARLGDAEGAVACVSNYVMLRIPCLERGNTPVADICSRVKYVACRWAHGDSKGY